MSTEDERADTDFEAFVRSLPDPGPREYPIVFYNREGDQLEVYLDGAMCYGKWVGKGVTLYLEQGTDWVVGFGVGGVRGLLPPSVVETGLTRYSDGRWVERGPGLRTWEHGAGS